MFKSRTSAGATEITRTCSKVRKTVLRLANEKTEQLYKVSHLCLDDHQFKKEELENEGELSEVCPPYCIKMLVLGTNWST